MYEYFKNFSMDKSVHYLMYYRCIFGIIDFIRNKNSFLIFFKKPTSYDRTINFLWVKTKRIHIQYIMRSLIIIYYS